MKKLIVLTFAMAVIFSCNKEKDKPANKCTTDVPSISKSYRLTAYTYKQTPSSQEMDYYNTLFPDACDRDNVIKFNANGTYELIDAGLVCSPSGSDAGQWSLSGNTMQIDGEQMTIESFDCNKLVISSSNVMVAGDKLKITLIQQ